MADDISIPHRITQNLEASYHIVNVNIVGIKCGMTSLAPPEVLCICLKKQHVCGGCYPCLVPDFVSICSLRECILA